jgi:UDP-2,4-diacetamido-2,4,6-trideoxy-beta-L-altropyranose hydrolase
VVVSGYYVANQVRNYGGFIERGAIIGVDNFDQKKIQDVLSVLLHDKKIPAIPRLIDGQSGARIRNVFVRANAVKYMTVRRAEARDCEQYFKWANDNSVRENSINTGEISWESHVKWFEAKVGNPNSCLLIFESQGLPLGQVRFDLQNGEWLISFSIAANFRGIGLARHIVALALSTLREVSKLPFIAIVKHENAASGKVFKAFDFELVSSPEDEYLKFFRKY